MKAAVSTQLTEMPAPQTDRRASPTQNLSGLCVLVLDDDANMRSLIRGTLTRCGCHNVLQSGDAREALRLFSTRTIDLVISDWMMEPMSGLEFLRELRRPERKASMPVLMLTGVSDPKDILQAQALKISGWLVKPITPQALLDSIGEVLRLPGKVLELAGDLAEEVEHLADRYRAKLADDLRDIEQLLATMPQQDHNVGHNWRTIGRILHGIQGQGGTFGFELITSIAAIGQELTRSMEGDIERLYHNRDELTRCTTALVQAIRLVLQNDVRGDGGKVGERLLDKLRSYTSQVHARITASSGPS
jgi:two-component system chemotaxis response regulator CheY